MEPDRRLSGDASEYILACLLRNKYGIVTQRFDIEGFDLIAFDNEHKVFKEGESPFYIQVRTRGATTTGVESYKKIIQQAERLNIQMSSFYMAVGFFKDNDIRTVRFFLIRWKDLSALKARGTYRFNKNKLNSLTEKGEIKKI